MTRMTTLISLISYEYAQNVLRMESLFDRRTTIFTNFTLKSLLVKQMKNIFKLKHNKHYMETRNKNGTYQVSLNNTERLRQSAGIQMQIVANKFKR